MRTIKTGCRGSHAMIIAFRQAVEEFLGTFYDVWQRKVFWVFHLLYESIAHGYLIHFFVLFIKVKKTVQADGISRSYVVVFHFNIGLERTTGADADKVQTAMGFFGHSRLQVDIGEGVEFVHHDINVVGTHARREHSDTFAVEIAGTGDEFTVLTFHLNLVEKRGNHFDTTRVANHDDVIGQLIGMQIQMI